MEHRALALAALLLCGAANGPPVDSRIPDISDFSRLPTILNVQASPSGQKLLIIRQATDERYEVEIRDKVNLAVGGLAFSAEPAEVRNAAWLSDDRILVSLRERVTSATGPGFWGQFYVVFDDRGVLKYRLPGESPEILTLRSAGRGAVYVAYDSTGDGSADVHRVDIESGHTERVLRGNNRRFGFQVDPNGEVRISATFDPDKFEASYWSRQKGGAGWKRIAVISPADRKEFRPVGFFNDDPNELTIIANLDANAAGLHVYDLAQGRVVRTLFRHDDVDVDDVVLSRDGRLLGARYATDRPRIEWFDADVRNVASSIEAALPERLVTVGDKGADGISVVRTDGPRDPGSFYLLNASNKVTLLGSTHPQLTGKKLAPVSLSRFTARDGRAIPLYVTRSANISGPAPLVVLPHGGPWGRDAGGFDEWAQMLAARGYVVAQPQFRGSRGLGRDLWLAGDREWGGRMQDDLDDTVKHLTAINVADPRRVAMLGWSYGGYAALTAAWRGNGLYRCTIAGAAVSSLDTINAGLDGNFVLRRIQKPTIAGTSPVDHLANATVPVLVIHGDIDATVPVSHGRNAARALKASKQEAQYIEVKGLDHQLDRFTVEHKRVVYAAFDKWLSGQCGFASPSTQALTVP